MHNLCDNRFGYGFLGLLLGLVIAGGIIVSFTDFQHGWWLMIVIPIAAALLAVWLGESIITLLKELIWWT